MKPIIFSTEMVRAILDGRKTQTRRVIKPQPESMKDGKLPKCPYQPGDILWVRETWYYEEHMHELTAGDPDLPSGRYKHRYICKASDPDYPVGNKGWRPSIHMPREAARLFLLVKAVRVERLQDITEQDAIAEGALYTDFGTHVPTWKASLDGGKTYHPARPQQHNGWHMSPVNSPDQCYFTATSAFAGYWNRLNAKRGHSWDTSPWVWVIEFSRTEAPS